MPLFLQSLCGFFLFAAIAAMLSENRRRIPWMPVSAGMGLQVVLALALLMVPAGRDAFELLNRLALALQEATKAGTSFVFGYLGGGPLPFPATDPGMGFVLAFQALPLVLVTSALSAVLFHWRVLPILVAGVSAVLERSLRIGGALSLGVTVNIFVGMIEAPLFIRPYLKELDRGELFVLMTSGMASIAGTVMVLYASILGPVIPDALGHLLIASIISAPAAVAIGLIMVPPTKPGLTGRIMPPQTATGTIDALTHGTMDGLTLLLNITAMLIVLVACVHIVNDVLSLVPAIDGAPLTLQRLFGWGLAPLTWFLGIPWAEAATAGSLFGTKTVLNELIAYVDMAHLPADALTPESRLIMTYALCGFANFGSLGIMIGGMGAMVPERRAEIVALGLRSIVAGTLATAMTGSVVGMMIWSGAYVLPAPAGG